jgi:hypothetical protein
MPAILPILTLLGLVPFVVFAFGAVGHIPDTAERMFVSLINYAALVLGFAGGVHWGLGLLPEVAHPNLRFGGGVLPLIVAWIALMLAQMVAPSVALPVLITGYLATVLVEHRASQRLLVPSRYMWTRWAFTFVAIVMMVMVLILRGLGQTIVF